jgi:hypothetical protein
MRAARLICRWRVLGGAPLDKKGAIGMNASGKRLAVAIGVALALAPLLLFTYFGLNTRLLGDDFAYLGLANRIGAWEAMLAWRAYWNGGYSSFLFYGVLAPLGAHAPPLFAFVVIASAFVAYSWLINTTLAYLKIGFERVPVVIALAALAAAATVNGLYTAQAYYWLTAAMVYTWPGMMFLLGLALAVEAARRLRGNRGRLLLALTAAFYAFINAGFSELFLVLQLTVMALISIFLLVFDSGAKLQRYRSLAAATFLGTFAGLAAQLSSPGFAIRSAVDVNDGYLVQPVRELSELIVRTLETTLLYAGHQQSFAGFMLVATAGMFATLIASKRIPADSNTLRIRVAIAPLASVLLGQLVFVLILWSHSSDSAQVLGRFSYGFTTVVVINLLLILLLLAMLWRRDRLGQALNTPNGLMIVSCLALLLICALFTLTQLQDIHYKASSYLFLTAVSILILLASQLALATGDPRLSRLLVAAAYITASALICLAALIGLKMFGAGYIIKRALASTTTMLMIAGSFTGITLGALIHRGYCLTDSNPFWIRSIRLICLLVTLAVAAGIVIGQSPRIAHVRRDVDAWAAKHKEIIQLRDAGDPIVYTKHFSRLITDHLGSTPSRYKSTALDWRHMLFYELDPSQYADECGLPAEQSTISPRVQVVCMIIHQSR